jgi:dienelactone hydrolase
MATIVVFHHALGLTAGVVELADRLRADGHRVHTPDVFAGQTFATIDAGIAHAQAIGFATCIERGVQAVADLPPDVVYVGMSLGVLPAQLLAQTRAGARGALLLHACVPVSEFGDEWPAAVPVQVHAMADDPFFVGDGDFAAAQALLEQTTQAELFLYPGDAHLFTDSGTQDYDAEATDVLLQRVLKFLEKM